MTYKRASFTIIGVITGLLCFLAILLSTPWGAKLSLYAVSATSSVQVEYKSGALLNDLVLGQLTIENDKTIIDAKNIGIKLHLRCLWKSQLCIDELSIASLQVNMKEGQATSSNELVEEAINSSSFTLPFTLKLKKFSLARAQIKSPELKVNLIDFSSALSINKNIVNHLSINLENARLVNANIKLYDKQSPSVKPIEMAWPLATLPKLYSPVKLAVRSLVVKKLTVNEVDSRGNENTLLATTDAAAKISWFKTKLLIDELSSTVEGVGALSLKGKVDFVPPYVVDLILKSSIKDFELLPQLNDTKQVVSLQGNLSDLVTNISSEGEIELSAQMSVNVTDANLPYKLKADVSQFTLPDNIAKVITPSTLLLQSEGDINQHLIDLKSNISGFGYQDASLVLSATYDEQIFKISTLHFEESHANNMLDIKGELQLGSRLLWDIKVESSGINLPNINKELSGRVQGQISSKGFLLDNEWAFTLDDSSVKGEINNVALTAIANIDINHKGKLAASNINLNYGGIAVKLEGYSDENWHVDGSVNIVNTALWFKDIESDLRSNISISGPTQQPEINLQGELTDLLMAGVSSDAVNFDLKYRPLDNHQHQVSFTSKELNLKDHRLNSVNLASRGDLSQQKVNVAWLGDSSIDLSINSNYFAQNDQWKVETDKVTFSLDEHVFKSTQPLKLLYDNANNTLALNKHCWLGTTSQLCLIDDTTVKLTEGELTLAIKLGSDLLSPFIPENIIFQSTFAGNVAIGWQQDEVPSVNAKLVISDGQLAVKKEGSLHKLLAWQKGQLNLQLNNESVTANIALLSQATTEIVNLSSVVLFADNRTIDSQLIINDLNLSPLQVFLPELTSLEGLLNTSLTIVGDLDKPTINGGIKLTQGKAKILGNINTLEDINMAFDFKGQQAVISGGLNINNAAATVKGDADWQDELKGNFDFDGESLHFSIPPDLTLTVSPHLNAQIKASELKVSGRIEVLDGKLLVNKLPQGSVSLSKDVIIVDDTGEQVANEKPFELYTNVRVVIADAFNVEGQGFVGRLGGELQVSQQANQPLQLFGSLKIPQGRYRAYGQDLSITKGIISFNGTANNPYVTMQATRSIEKENIIVGIDATGLANSLNIKLFSKPTMQQSETLSYLVRGRGLDAETSDSNTAIGVALGSALTNFSGVLTQIEKLPLINRIEIDGDDEQASIAGYLGDQVYIKYGVGIMEPINELTVRFYLLSRLWVETVSGLENSADIYYSFDIK